MLGVQSQITGQVRKKLGGDAWKSMLHLMWEAMVQAKVLDSVGEDEDLYILLLSGTKTEVKQIDFAKIKLEE